MRTVKLLGLLFLVGCGGGGPCQDRSGTYVSRATARTGNCGAIAESVVTYSNSKPATATGCTGKQDLSGDNCRITSDISCPNGSDTAKMVGVVDWNQEGSSATGVMDITVDGPDSCHGTYDVTFARI